jgi:hypothetical protein
MVTQHQLKAIWSRSSRERSPLWQHSSSGPGGVREVALRMDCCPIRYPQKCTGFAVRVAQKWGDRSGHGCRRGDERGGRLGAVASASLQADAPSQAAWGASSGPTPNAARARRWTCGITSSGRRVGPARMSNVSNAVRVKSRSVAASYSPPPLHPRQERSKTPTYVHCPCWTLGSKV